MIQMTRRKTLKQLTAAGIAMPMWLALHERSQTLRNPSSQISMVEEAVAMADPTTISTAKKVSP